MPLLIIDLLGPPYDIGRQHGRQVQARRPLLVQVMETRLAELRRLDADRPAVLKPVEAALEILDRPLLDFLRGLAEALALDYTDLLRYTLSSYLKDLHVARQRQPGLSRREGCTTWAATAPVTRDGLHLLAKNRDYHRDHIPLQILARVQPQRGYRYLCLGSAGSPLVFSSGINGRGLAVADTHVLSQDLGPGLPRFSLMRELLEHHATTASALDYLRSAQHMGGGTLILADAAGHLAVCESGHQRCGTIETRQGFLVSTNHFVTPALVDQWLEDEPSSLRGNSQARRRRVLAALSGLGGRADVAWAQALMSAHGAGLDAICRHALVGSDAQGSQHLDTTTISSAIYLPAEPAKAGRPGPLLVLAGEQPCQADWQRHPVIFS